MKPALPVLLSSLARADLQSIEDYYGPINPAATIRMLLRVEGAIATLSENPLIGKTGKVPGTREFAALPTPFVLVYRAESSLEVLRILHHAMQWPSDG